MATIVNNPSSGDSSGGMGTVIAAVLIIALILFLGYYFLPMLRQGASQSGTPSVKVPDKVDINVNQPKQ